VAAGKGEVSIYDRFGVRKSSGTYSTKQLAVEHLLNNGPLRARRPCRPVDGWGAAFEGDATALADNPIGARINFAPRRGNPCVASVSEVVERSGESVAVPDFKLSDRSP